MHTKFRNSIIALSAVLAFVVGGAFFSEPLRPAQADSARTLSPEARIALALLNATVSIAHASAELDEAEAQDAAAEPSRQPQARRQRNARPVLGMPYFSFASFLPRPPQES
ncbi:hypothetical protein [Chiayiivirga flava]|uniref:Uncharacterized protein n=1 Tax=Chiayiivirga flava TaxID=659595 RepID=A0A7W8G0D8_9GAMM|nr:hypothetical protein [Chiayiivirga flava]MBB5206660.1 hypothetical protein [Chiayiivirga flava]